MHAGTGQAWSNKEKKTQNKKTQAVNWIQILLKKTNLFS